MGESFGQYRIKKLLNQYRKLTSKQCLSLLSDVRPLLLNDACGAHEAIVADSSGVTEYCLGWPMLTGPFRLDQRQWSLLHDAGQTCELSVGDPPEDWDEASMAWRDAVAMSWAECAPDTDYYRISNNEDLSDAAFFESLSDAHIALLIELKKGDPDEAVDWEDLSLRELRLWCCTLRLLEGQDGETRQAHLDARPDLATDDPTDRDLEDATAYVFWLGFRDEDAVAAKKQLESLDLPHTPCPFGIDWEASNVWTVWKSRSSRREIKLVADALWSHRIPGWQCHRELIVERLRLASSDQFAEALRPNILEWIDSRSKGWDGPEVRSLAMSCGLLEEWQRAITHLHAEAQRKERESLRDLDGTIWVERSYADIRWWLRLPACVDMKEFGLSAICDQAEGADPWCKELYKAVFDGDRNRVIRLCEDRDATKVSVPLVVELVRSAMGSAAAELDKTLFDPELLICFRAAVEAMETLDGNAHEAPTHAVLVDVEMYSNKRLASLLASFLSVWPGNVVKHEDCAAAERDIERGRPLVAVCGVPAASYPKRLKALNVNAVSVIAGCTAPVGNDQGWDAAANGRSAALLAVVDLWKQFEP